jgi:hypothetical protein
VEALVLSLNAYLLVVMEAIIGESAFGAPTDVDQIFANIRIAEEARERAANEIKKEQISTDNLTVLLGKL